MLATSAALNFLPVAQAQAANLAQQKQPTHPQTEEVLVANRPIDMAEQTHEQEVRKILNNIQMVKTPRIWKKPTCGKPLI